MESGGGASPATRPRFLAVVNTEHGAELEAVPNGRCGGAHEGAIRFPLWSQDSGEAFAPARNDANGLCYQARGALSRSRPELRVEAQEASSCHPAGRAAASQAGSPRGGIGRSASDARQWIAVLLEACIQIVFAKTPQRLRSAGKELDPI